jgi:hypothetical protein
MVSFRSVLGTCAVAAFAFASTSALAELRSTTPASASAVPATASTLVVNLAGWEAWGGFGNAQNTEAFFNIGAGSQVLGFEWSGLVFTAEGSSYQEEFIISVNDIDGSEFMDVSPADGLSEPGTFGPSSGTWGVDGLSFGAPFTAADGVVWVTVYDYFNDADRDAVVSAGTLTIFYAPIPEPGTYGLMALGLLGVAAVARRRKAD